MEFIDFENLKDKFGIYIITNTINDMVYVGQTRQFFKKRYWHHYWKLRKNTHDNNHLQNAFNLYGENNFKFEILEITNDISKLNDLEIKYISQYRELNTCYNLQSGGQTVSNYERTDDIKRRIGEKNRINMLGKTHTEETKLKMSKSRMGNDYGKVNYVINEHQAFQIKNLLMQGIKPSKIAKDLNVTYKSVNGILSGNSWSIVNVEGWDNYFNNRSKSRRIPKEEQYEIYKLLCTKDVNRKELAIKYGTTVSTLNNIIKRFKNK